MLRFGLFDYFDSGAPRPTADAATLSGNGGQGAMVRGYLLSIDCRTNSTVASPLELLTRTGLNDNNLMGRTEDYVSLGSGPAGGDYTNAPLFEAGMQYTLEFTVSRLGTNLVEVGATITGGGTSLSWQAFETNAAYHRFDSFAIRPDSLESSADSFSIAEFKVEVLYSPHGPPQITEQPADAIADRGGSASFQVAATGSASLSYQWQFNGTNLPDCIQFSGVKTTNLVVVNVTPANLGGYSVLVFGSGEIVTSRVAALRLKGIIQNQGDGSFRLLFAGPPGSTWRIQCTEHLSDPNWRDVATLTADSLGNYECLDWPTNAPARFYRSVVVWP